MRNDLLFGGPGSGCAGPNCGRPKLQDKYERHGMKISIENKRGSYRTGQNSQGVKWRKIMKADYGYIRGATKDNTHEKRDVYVGKEKNAKNVYIINQLNRQGTLDEQKYMVGYKSLSDAKASFLAHVHQDRFGSIRPMSVEQFKSKIYNPAYEGKIL